MLEAIVLGVLKCGSKFIFNVFTTLFHTFFHFPLVKIFSISNFSWTPDSLYANLNWDFICVHDDSWYLTSGYSCRYYWTLFIRARLRRLIESKPANNLHNIDNVQCPNDVILIVTSTRKFNSCYLEMKLMPKTTVSFTLVNREPYIKWWKSEWGFLLPIVTNELKWKIHRLYKNCLMFIGLIRAYIR